MNTVLRNRNLHVYLLAILVLSCVPKKNDRAEEHPKGTLIVQSGFEGDTEVVNVDKGDVDIIGTDHSVDPPNSWTSLENTLGIGSFHIQFQGGDTSMRKARIIEDPIERNNKVLQYWLKSPNVGYEKEYGGKSRIQTNFYENDSLYEIYYKYRMYLTEDWNLLSQRSNPMEWFIMAEFWNNAG